MMSTKIELGKSKVHIVNAKAKYKEPNTGFCNSPTCLAMVEITDTNTCKRCFQPVVRKNTFESIIKRFQTFLEINKPILQTWIATMPEHENLKIPIQLGKQNYYVPLRYFLEFENITSSDDFNDSKNVAYANFFGYLKSVCKHTKH